MGNRLKSSYGEFCSRHNEAVQLYKDLRKSDVSFQAFIKVRLSVLLYTQVVTTSEQRSNTGILALNSCHWSKQPLWMKRSWWVWHEKLSDTYVVTSRARRSYKRHSENPPVCLLLAFRWQCVRGVLCIRAIQMYIYFTYLLTFGITDSWA